MQNVRTVAWYRKSIQNVLLVGVLVTSASCTPDTSTPTPPMSGDTGTMTPDSAANEPDTQSAADATTSGPDITPTDAEAGDTTTVLDDIAIVVDAITDSGVADEVTAPVDPCESVDVLDEDSIYSWFESDIYPLLAESPGNGGCASCHSPGSGNGMIIWPDPTLTLQWLWADGYFSTNDSPDTLPYVLKEIAPIQMPFLFCFHNIR